MKIVFLNLVMIFCLFSCNLTTQDKNSKKENTIISKIRHKKNNSEIDTLWVSQNDSTVFRKDDFMMHRPCTNPEMQTKYDLIDPKVGSYYFIYNDQKQLVLEGKYTKDATYEGAAEKAGNFYDQKTYIYKNNGKLKGIHFMEDGINSKFELYDRKKRLKEITYYDKQSSDKNKIEFYDDGQLQETRIYTSFDNYHTVKADH